MKLLKITIISAVVGILGGCGEKHETSASNTPVAPSFVEVLKYPLKVKDVGLGVVITPCKPKEETYVDILQKPVRIQLECTVGIESDSTDIIFSSDGRSVVRVTRKQYLTPSDPEPSEIVKAAINYYGPPKDFSDGNWLANYGDAYTITYNGNAASASLNETGMGLLVKGYLCADGNWGTVKCGNLGTRLIKYDLVDIDAFNKQKEDGKQKLSAKGQEQIKNQKF